MSAVVSISEGDLTELIARALAASKVAEASARSVARALVEAEIDGQKGHGLSRVPMYAAQARVGKVDGLATPTLTATRTASLMVDCAHGFFFPAFDLALPRVVAAAREAGVVAAGFARSHHYGVAGRPVERLAEAGLVAFICGNTPEAMAAWGGRRAVFGTNPLAFAAPIPGRAPLVVDMALSEVARSKVRAAADKGEPIPPTWAVDATGKPTTDPKTALAGTLLPAGGAKGAALALMVEVLAVALTGGRLAFEATSFLDDKGGPPGVGQLLIAIDPSALAGADVFAERILALVSAIEADPPARLPGSRRLALRETARRDGIGVDARLLAEVRTIAG
jgi:(2R)-3-sulfolactate dehydrogenase (NADP+)